MKTLSALPIALCAVTPPPAVLAALREYEASLKENGYALPNRDIFHPRAAARDWEIIFAMFHRQIPPYPASR